MLISQRIERLSVAHDDSRRTVGRFLLEQGANLERYSMQQVADVTFTSKATLVRIAKQLGFSGWRQFTTAYLAEVRQQDEHGPDVDPNRPFSAASTDAEIAERVCRVRTESAQHTLELLDEGTLTHATDLLWNARRIACFGISVNELLLRLFQRKMLTIGVDVTLTPQSEYGVVAESLGKRDCALIVSYSGDNSARSPLRQVERLRRRGVPIVALTSMGDNYLRSTADCTLTVLSQERLYSKIATYSTEESISLLLDALFSCYFVRAYQEHWDYKIGAAQASETDRRADGDRLAR